MRILQRSLLSTFTINSTKKGVQIENEPFEVIATLQDEMDFPNILSFLANHNRSETIFALLAFPKLT